MTNYNKLDSESKKKVDDFFNEWILFKKWNSEKFKFIEPEIVFDNFKKDHFLKFNLFLEIVKYIVKNKKGNIEDDLIELRNYLRKNYCFKGSEIEVSPDLIGTVVLKDKLSDFLLDEPLGLFNNPKEIEIFMAKDPSDYDYDEKLCILRSKERHVWLSWSEHNSALSPFVFSDSRNKEEICNALGLSESYFENDIILVVFKPTSNKNMKKPTIADANLDNDLWRPTELDITEYGLSKSRTPLTLKNGYDSKRPESVIKSKYLPFSLLNKKLNNHE